MEYKLFEEFITLQALLKDLGMIQSGGAIKSFLSEHQVYFNGQLETRRGKKLRRGDQVVIPDLEIDILLTEPSQAEVITFSEEKAEKERITKLVKNMNKELIQKNSVKKYSHKNPKKTGKKAPRFPGM
ncbi:hypothetical protein STRDD10_01085 [Streptococcus sp. DD10]|uniref:S4 domain-containing protein YaaA n=1 Tax=Streptococcus sp. DD10 TaxID=1777878 RepID=UPI00079578B7|nr:S4 domain-containing protein YaaA [Streptococcus sp. DD10]KXT74268.1 hypothetical protein STRDD10_01085 [Streptococcus sp. DD10]